MVPGAGQVGALLARALRARGHRVRAVRRRPVRIGPRDIEVVGADVSDPGEVAHLTDGAACAYCCARPGPLDWAPVLLSVARGVAEGTARSGANLVVLDDLSPYGRAPVIGPDTPCRPRSPGGRIRAQATALLLDPAVRGHRRVVVARAADLFGPGVTSAAVFGERFFRRVLSGRSAGVYGDPDLPHSYSYVSDVVEGLAALGTCESAGGVYLLPVEPVESTRDVIRRFYRALGVELEVAQLSTWGLRLREFFSLTAEDLGERVYQWEQPFVVDDRRTRAQLGIAPTPWGKAVAATLAWAREAFDPGR